MYAKYLKKTNYIKRLSGQLLGKIWLLSLSKSNNTKSPEIAICLQAYGHFVLGKIFKNPFGALLYIVYSFLDVLSIASFFLVHRSIKKLTCNLVLVLVFPPTRIHPQYEPLVLLLAFVVRQQSSLKCVDCRAKKFRLSVFDVLIFIIYIHKQSASVRTQPYTPRHTHTTANNSCVLSF